LRFWRGLLDRILPDGKLSVFLNVAALSGSDFFGRTFFAFPGALLVGLVRDELRLERPEPFFVPRRERGAI